MIIYFIKVIIIRRIIGRSILSCEFCIVTELYVSSRKVRVIQSPVSYSESTGQFIYLLLRACCWDL